VANDIQVIGASHVKHAPVQLAERRDDAVVRALVRGETKSSPELVLRRL
jgi:hypothetical protein